MDIFSIISGAPPVNSLIPARNPNAIVGSTWVALNMNLMGPQRDQNILNEFMAGNIPDFLRNFVPMTVNGPAGSITYLVMADGLCIGQNNDYFRCPMSPLTAQTIANQYDCTLPTRKMVNDIWSASVNKLQPMPFGPPFDATMSSTARFQWSNNTINTQIQSLGLNYSALTSGQKKDIIISPRLLTRPRNVGIYGWCQTNGQPIQGLNCVSHDDMYYDYAHQARMICQDVLINNTIPAR